jgi:hypothetical protein
MQEVPISCGFLAFSAVAALLSHFVTASDILSWFVNGSETLAQSGRNNDATWRSLCRALDWSKSRAVYELQNGLPHRTVPPLGHAIDWHDPEVQRSLDVTTSEVTIARALEVVKGEGDIAFIWPGTERLTVGIEVLALSPPAHAPKATTVSDSARWAVAATRNLQAENKVRKDTTKAELARLLEAEAQKAVKAGRISRALKASYLENQLVPWGIWPLSSFE